MMTNATPSAPSEGVGAGDSVRAVFDLFDLDGSGTVSTEDLPFLLKSIGMGPDVLSFADVTSLQLSMDPASTGRISFGAFQLFVAEEMSAAHSVEEMWRAFRLFDVDKKGYITQRDLVRVACEECCGVLSPTQCAFIVKELQSGAHRGGITFADFKAAMSSVEK